MTQKTVPLYNLDLGDDVPPNLLRAQLVGPFTIRMVPEYDEVARLLPRPMTTTTPARRGEWVKTADATFDDAAPAGILSAPEVPNEGGIWDLCRLLTLITDAWVVTDPEGLPRRNPSPPFKRLCHARFTFQGAATAWEHREQLRAAKLTLALLLHDEAIGLGLYEASAALHFAALDIITTQHVIDRVYPRGTWTEAKKRTLAALADCPLSVDLRSVAEDGLIGFWTGGGLGARDKLLRLLGRFGVVSPPASKAAIDGVRAILDVRNALTHSGELPEIRHSPPEASKRMAHAILFYIVPSIIQMALGAALGFSKDTPGNDSQDPAALREFFEKGTYWGDDFAGADAPTR